MRESRLPVAVAAVLLAALLLTSTPATATAGTTGPALAGPVGLGRSARAAPLGPLTLGPTSGSTTANPLFTSVTTAAPCPAGYGRNVGLRIGPAGGTGGLLLAPQNAGGYDANPVTFPATIRTLTQALGVETAEDGDYDVYVECFGLTTGRHPERFQTTISVAGDRWQIRTGGPAPAGPSTPVPALEPPSTTAPNSPSAGPGPTVEVAPTIEPTPAAAAPVSPSRVAGGGDDDPSLAPSVLLIGGLAVAVAAVALLVARRRRAAATGSAGAATWNDRS
ncbi:hypothetical protein BDK92_4057 [Micromonospora pisi]|uniref:LPXTG-motif cell wall-anchored protein n=1 Tax=Micromonospora pisi TaxID=589240 RepID=A0A495JLI1_9ACTN|nr:hypothetical protein [Micromonospora pisi]RKR89701.1 hypothetical protein BDK92_4057 [Micromonospora pisi]